jgi:DNA-directed RNA polymerase specialized sigma24 family protein
MSELPVIPEADDPEAALAAVLALRRLADRLERDAIVRALAQGWSWSRIAQALGVSKQAVHKRFADLARHQSLSGES